MFGGVSESQYNDLNDFKYGCLYNGNATKDNFINYPTDILTNSDPQVVVISIFNSWGGRGYQLAFSKLGFAIRYYSGMWSTWNAKLFRNLP